MAALSAAEDIVSDGESPPELPLGATERDRSGETLLRTVSRLCGEISLNSYEVTVGDVVTVQWYVSPDTQGNPGLQPSERDWIGLFSISNLDPDSLISHRTRGDNLDNSGRISWTILAQYITEPTMKLCFCFYTSNNTLLAQSDTLTVHNPTLSLRTPVTATQAQPIDITIKDLECSGLRVKTFGTPDPFLKIKVIPGPRLPKLPYHAHQLVVTPVVFGSTSPSWSDEFRVQATPTDVLEVEVRDKFNISRPSATHFLGRVRINLSCIGNSHTQNVCTCPLEKRWPTDRVSGTLGVKLVNESVTPTSGSPPPMPTHRGTTPSTSEESVVEEYPPESAVDRVRWIRSTLHGDAHRRQRHTSPNRHHSFIVRGSRQDSLVQSMSVQPVTVAPVPTRESFLTDSLSPSNISQEHRDRLQVDHFVARASRNQLMRQFSVPVGHAGRSESLEEPHSHTAEPHSHTAEPHSHTAETHSHTAEPHSHTAEPHSHTAEPHSHTAEPHSHTAESHSHTAEPHSHTVEPHSSSDNSSPVVAHQGEELNDVTTPPDNMGGAQAKSMSIEEAENVPEPDPTVVNKTSSSSLLSVERRFERLDSVEEGLKHAPAFRFITRPDLYEYMKSTGNNTVLLNLTLLQLVQSIRSDHTLLSKYINSTKLITALNQFALTDCDLPDGWERKVDRSTGKVVFLDHNNHMTTFIDPRLPFEGSGLKKTREGTSGMMRNRPVVTPPQRASSNPPLPPSSIELRPAVRSETTPASIDIENVTVSIATPPDVSQATPLSEEQRYSLNVVHFLQQPDIFTILATRYEEPMSHDLRGVIDHIITGGVEELERLQSQCEDVYFQLVLILSLFEEDIAHQLFEATPSNTTPPSPPPVPRRDSYTLAIHATPPTPPSRDIDNIPDMDLESNEYAGIPLTNIIEFFNLPNIYHIVLRNQGSIQPAHRRHIAEIEGFLTFELADVLQSDFAARRLIWQLKDEIRRNTNIEEQLPLEEGTRLSRPPITAVTVMQYMGQPNVLEIIEGLTELSIEERFTIQHCSFWDTSFIELELNRDSNLKNLVERIAPHIHEYVTLIPSIPLSGRPHPPNNNDTISTPSEHSSQSVPHSNTNSTTLAMPRRLSDPILPRPPLSDDDTDTTSTSSSSSDTDSSVSPVPSRSRSLRVPELASQRPTASSSSGSKNKEFAGKLQSLQNHLDSNNYAYNSYSTLSFTLRRDHLLEDAYRKIMTSSTTSLRARRCHVTWDQEEGLDYGGPQREFFFKLSRHLFNPYYGLFEYTSQGSYTVQISRYSAQVENCHQWFRFAGRVIGYAIIQSNLLDVFFARHVYKSLLGRPYVLSDVEAVDIAFYNSLKYVLEDDPAPLELTFTVTEESFGEPVEKDLKPGGAKIPVTNDNKKHYVDLMIQWKLCKGIEKQTESLVEGLKEMLPLEYLQPFNANELEWVIAGTPEVNMEDWKKNTNYWGGYSSTHAVIKWFWDVIESCSDEEKLKFLQFATGTSSIPYEGFKALRGSSQQITKFTIDRHTGDAKALPIAHTCFNRIDLPPYCSREEMRDKILYAILETDGFGNA